MGRRIDVAGSLPGAMFPLLSGVLQTIELSISAVVEALAFIALGANVRQAPAPPSAV